MAHKQVGPEPMLCGLDDLVIDVASGAFISLQDYWHEDTHLGAWVCLLKVPPKHRNKGIASRLLTRLCEAADNAGVALYLECCALDPKWSDEALARWYSCWGFEPVDDNELVLVRHAYHHQRVSAL